MGINTRDNDEKQAGGPLSSNPDTRAEDIANALDQLSYEQQQFAGAYSGILSPQDLVDIANKIIEIQDDEEFMKALSETLSGRQFARYFQDAKDAQRLRQKLEAKNGRDLLYLALLQDQLDEINQDIASEAKRLGYADMITRKACGVYLHVNHIVTKQLQDIGVNEACIEELSYCTSCHNERFFSYRADKHITGRIAAIAVLQ